MPLINWTENMSFQNYIDHNNIVLPDSNKYIRQVSNQQEMRIGENLVNIEDFNELMPYNYYIGVIMIDDEPGHWFVYYLSSIDRQLNIVSTWGTGQWGIPLLYNRINEVVLKLLAY